MQLGSFVLAMTAILGVTMTASAQYAVEVVSYDSGSNPASVFMGPDYTLSSAALGSPSRTTGTTFPSVVSPFSGPYNHDQIVSIGEGGKLTLRLSNYAIPQAGGPEIGVFESVSITDSTVWPNLTGVAGSPASTFGGDSALVEVSEYGSSWVGLGIQLFNMPTSAYTDLTDPYSSTPGSNVSDFQKPLTASLSDFDGKSYYDASTTPHILDIFDGSGGGTWLDISGTGLAKVGFIRFLVADDGDDSITAPDISFEIDAVSIATGAMGTATVPEPSALVLLLLATPFVTRRR